MKKFLTVLTIGVVCLTSLTACGNSRNSSNGWGDDWSSNVTYWDDIIVEELLEEEILEEEILEEEEA